MTSATKTDKVFIRTFGCQMNEYDSAKMADVLNVFEGFEKTLVPEEADVILYNSCSVREKASEKLFSDLGRIQDLKQDNPDLLIGVGGCVASQEGAAIVKRAPYVDLVFGADAASAFTQMIQASHSGAAQVDISFPRLKNSIICPLRGWKARLLLFPSWGAAPSIAASVWCRIRAAKKFPGLSKA